MRKTTVILRVLAIKVKTFSPFKNKLLITHAYLMKQSHQVLLFDKNSNKF